MFYIITKSLFYLKIFQHNAKAGILPRLCPAFARRKSGIDCELSEKDALIEELCEKEDSFSAKDKKKSDDKEAAEEIRKKAMERSHLT